MSYYMSRTIESGFDEAVARVVDALKREGFGVLRVTSMSPLP
jgi:uncharacterized protein (DUF302 family)